MKKVFQIVGMHCASCKVLLESKVSEIQGVKSVAATIKTGEMVVEGEYDPKLVREVVTALGYDLDKEDKGYFSKNPKVYVTNIVALLIVIMLFYVYISLEGVGVGSSFGNNEMTLLVALFLGLAAGLSTCMALTGSIVLAITAKYRESNPKISAQKLVGSQLIFNLGRIIGFGVFGALLGVIGKSIAVSPGINSIMILVISSYMLFVAIQLSEISPKLSKINFNILERLGLSRKFSGSNAGPFVAGVLTFFLPCGFTQLAQVAAVASGDPIKGALIMSIFALGTAPGLVLIGTTASIVKGKLLKYFYRFVAMILLVASIFNIYSVANIRVIGGSQSGSSVDVSKSYQEVRITANERGYTPNKIAVKAGIPIRLIINSESQFTCANYFVIPDLKINKVLEKGENIIEIEPQKSGEIDFACSMGMYNGQLIIK